MQGYRANKTEIWTMGRRGTWRRRRRGRRKGRGGRERKYLYVVCPISLRPSEQYFIQNLMAARQIPYTVNETD